MRAKRLLAWITSITLIVGLFIGAAPVTSYGADDDPIEIRTVADLYAVNNNSSGKYILMNDLDANSGRTA